jgi:hypothetical protein
MPTFLGIPGSATIRIWLQTLADTHGFQKCNAGLAGPPPGLSVALACIIAIAIVTSGIWMTAV